jgi:hypothetical protein
MRNKEQKRGLSVQAIAGLPTIGMIPTKLFQGWNARLHAQRGYFTIHGNKNKPLDKLMPDCVRRVEIPPEAIPAGRALLEVAGVNDYSIFPDLEGLKNDIRNRRQLIETRRLFVTDTNLQPPRSFLLGRFF